MWRPVPYVDISHLPNKRSLVSVIVTNSNYQRSPEKWWNGEIYITLCFHFELSSFCQSKMYNFVWASFHWSRRRPRWCGSTGASPSRWCSPSSHRWPSTWGSGSPQPRMLSLRSLWREIRIGWEGSTRQGILGRRVHSSLTLLLTIEGFYHVTSIGCPEVQKGNQLTVPRIRQNVIKKNKNCKKKSE